MLGYYFICNMDSEEFTCPICSKTYANGSNLRQHIKRKHARERINPDKIFISNEKVENIPSNIIKCPKCEFILPHDNAVNMHMNTNHKSIPFRHKCFVCLKPFYTNLELQKHIDHVHPPSNNEEFPSMVTNTASNSFVFGHPFSMIVAGPSKSGKTYWVINLLLNAKERISPSPNKIVYCYAHWQSKYDVLKKNIPTVQWHEGMPTKSYLDEISDAIVILDDLMAASVNNEVVMSIFTERSHHQNISVILLMQNLFHQGKQSRSINTNAQFLVLFKNPRDRLQIKTLAMQMFPQKWRKFLETFEHETNKPRGKVILDFSSTTSDENRIVKSCNLQDIIQNTQKQQTIINNPYYAKAVDEKSQINDILNNPTLSNIDKEIEYEQGISNYSKYMKKAEPISRTALPFEILPNVKTSAIKAKQLPIPDGEEFHGKMEDILKLPYEPARDDNDDHLKNILDLPPLSEKDYAEDSGDENHMKNFISYSDDEDTVKRKQAQKEYDFRKRVDNKKQKRSTRNKKPYEKSE